MHLGGKIEAEVEEMDLRERLEKLAKTVSFLPIAGHI
jgi:hypothetical protein